MNRLRHTALAASVALSLAATFSATSASAAVCTTNGATITSIDGTAVNYNATACEGAATGNLNPSEVEALIESGTIFSALLDNTLDWTYLDKAEQGDNAGDVQVDGFDTTGTWQADFSPATVNKVILLLKGATQYSLFLFNEFTPTPASFFEGTYDMAAAGIENSGGNTPDLSHLDVAGIFIQTDGPPQVVPLPAGLPLLIGGLASLAVLRRRLT